MPFYKYVGGDDIIPSFDVDRAYREGRMCIFSKLDYEADKRKEEEQQEFYSRVMAPKIPLIRDPPTLRKPFGINSTNILIKPEEKLIIPEYKLPNLRD